MIVVDTSVAIAWCIADERDARSDKLLEMLRRMRGVVPAIWPLECVNAMLVAERRGRSEPEAVTEALRFLFALPIDVEGPPTPERTTNVWHLARSHALTAYDAAYLEVAQRCGATLVSYDRRLCDAASNLGLAVL